MAEGKAKKTKQTRSAKSAVEDAAAPKERKKPGPKPKMICSLYRRQ